MTKKIVQKKDYLGQPICKGKKEDGKCPKYDVNTEKECPDDWNEHPGIDFHTNEKWECEEIIETEEITVTSGGEGTKKDVACCMVKTKHENCLKCKDMDCSHGTCSDFVNEKGRGMLHGEDEARELLEVQGHGLQ